MSESTHEIEIEVRNQDGLHMRPAMQFVDLASSFDSDITVSHQEMSIDGKSIMQMTMLAATCGARLKVVAVGPDAADAVLALKTLAENEFGDSSKNALSEKEGQ